MDDNGSPPSAGRLARLAAVLACLLAFAAAAAQGTLAFVEETAQAGVHHSYDGGWEFFPGGGVAAFDCSGDGLQDLYLAGGSGDAALYVNVGAPGRALRFEPRTPPAARLTNVTGAYPLDVDGDGNVDLAVLRVGENVLLRGTGDCGFERANEAWGFDGGDAWSVAFAALWESGERLPSLIVGNYVDRSAPGSPWGTCSANELVRPRGGVYGPPTPLEPGYCALSILASDFDRDLVPDVWVSNDKQYYLAGDDRSGTEQMWRLAPGAPPYLYTEADGWDPLRIFGMGVASADLTGDGLPEFYLSNMADNRLRVLEPGAAGPTFADDAYPRGLSAHRPFTGGDTRPSTAWHAQFEDVNQDGYLDLFVAKGNVEAMPEFAAQDPNDLLLGRPDGTFAEVAADVGLLSFARARGAQVTDLDGDGLLDLVVVNREAEAQLWRNVSVGLGHALMVRLHQEGADPAGIGAWLEVDLGGRVVQRELHVGGGHASGHWGWTHVGLGDAESVELRVQWPDGVTQSWSGVPADSFVDVTRGSATFQARPFPAPVDR